MVWDRIRSDWLGNGPFTGPAFNPAVIDRIVIHYIGTARAPRDFRAWMLNTHKMSMAKSPPYAFMYNSAVDLDGLLWQGRGVEFRNAANRETNGTTYSICVATDGPAAANPAQVAAIRKMVKYVRDFTRKNLLIVGHRDVAATACPGDGLYRQILAGSFESGNPPPSRENVEMIVLDFQPGTPNWMAFLWAGNTLSWLVNGNADKILRDAKATRATVSAAELQAIIDSSHTVNGPPATLDGNLRAAWLLRRR